MDLILAYLPRTFGDFVLMFWFALIFELPRFVFATLAVGFAEFFRPGSVTAPSNRRSPWEKPPLVSLLLAGHNEGACLETAVRGLKEQTYQNIEIIVIDDGSTDDMADVGKQLLADGQIDSFLSTGLRGGKSSAANYGLGHCRGDIVMIADIDTSFDIDAIERVIEPLADPEVGAVSGNLAVRNPRDSVVTRYQSLQYLLSISLGRRFSSMVGMLFIASGAFAAFRRHALLGIGGWEVGPGEDADITAKLRQAGWKIRFAPDAWALTDVPVDALSLARQRLRWNRSLIRVRLRKFAPMFYPWRANFSLSNAAGHADILFFQGLLPLSFFFYLLTLFAQYGTDALAILAIVSTGYVITTFFAALVALALNPAYADWRLLVYVPGYSLFNAYFLRAVSVYSYIDEWFLRKSYKDSYVPTRVLDAAEKF